MKIKVIPDMSITNMSHLVDDMIEILKHNHAVIAEIGAKGFESLVSELQDQYECSSSMRP